ncbi:hypothetical protein U879_04310 [Defluviimonas sp. 20V17]|uniref:Electron transporter n=1 Tax=Allgaiera indica TaxID=765699 RepID=A0AAN5A1G1_9RHOB|nr:SCO family protein [Allgaiera indica]KDB04894.1 hypothetical protein U879_04310 [Defluviimonas sp. 20V17]GHE05598.1 electron transporter [Allgaiera indica]SDX77681.1 protein SCO1/2 [Allgaiera indica]
MADLTRRSAIALVGASALAACRKDKPWNSIDVEGALPALDFALTRARDAKLVTQADYRGKLVMLFFGFTHCPDVCPLTMGNLLQVLDRMGEDGRDIRILFVTVDPRRDTPPVLKAYVEDLSPQVVGLRGTPNQLAQVARRYRVTYKVIPANDTRPYQVVHGPSVYVFDRAGDARLMIPRFYDNSADIKGVTEDMTRLAHGA